MSKMPLVPGDRNAEWLQECSSNWQFLPIKYLCAINRRVLPETTQDDAELEYIDISSVDSLGNWKQSEPLTFSNAPSRARRVLIDGDVLISTVRTYLKAIALVDKVSTNLICSTGFAVLSGGKQVHPKYLAYWVRSNYFVSEIVARSVGVSYPAINASDIGSLPFPLLDIGRQRTIAAFLDREVARIDKLISKKERQIELLQEKRSALISHSVTKGLNPKAKMKDSGIEWLGEIPEHWKVMRLRHVGDAIIGLTFDPADVVDEHEGTLVLRASNVSDGQVVLEDNVFVRTKIPERLVTKIGDILICSRSGSRALIGKSAKIDENSAGFTFGTFMTIFRSTCNDYLFYVCNSNLFDYQSGAFLTSTINQLTVGNLYSFEVPIPPSNEQSAISSFLDRETARIDTLTRMVKESISTLREYRTALISAAVTGKIDVREEAA